MGGSQSEGFVHRLEYDNVLQGRPERCQSMFGPNQNVARARFGAHRSA